MRLATQSFHTFEPLSHITFSEWYPASVQLLVCLLLVLHGPVAQVLTHLTHTAILVTCLTKGDPRLSKIEDPSDPSWKAFADRSATVGFSAIEGAVVAGGCFRAFGFPRRQALVCV